MTHKIPQNKLKSGLVVYSYFGAS